MEAAPIRTRPEAARFAPSEVSRAFLQQIAAGDPGPAWAYRLWDRSEGTSQPGVPPQFTLVIQHPGALRNMFLPTRVMTFLEAYLADDFDIEGDMEAFWGFVQHLFARGFAGGTMRRREIEERLQNLPHHPRQWAGRRSDAVEGSMHTPERDRQAIASHYDVSNEFYALWLDRRMLYTCAYFEDAGDTLEEAQLQKLDHVCKKLRLKPGDRLLDLGCGWGGLAMHAAAHYGVQARGVTLSRQQAEYAQERIRALGLGDSCRVDLMDYRDVQDERGFDKISSIGLAEHIGEAMLPAYFRKAHSLLKPGGVMMNHAIGSHPANPVSAGATFLAVHVFPDGELQPIGTVTAAAEGAGFEVRDVESLREHYQLTCRHWYKRLEYRQVEAIALSGDATYRVWRTYMSWSAYGFGAGNPTLYQTLLAKPDNGKSGLPLTRDDWYS